MLSDERHSPGILQVSTQDTGGGAERVAFNLFQAYRERGYASWLAVGRKRCDDADILEIPTLPQRVAWARPCWMLHGRLAPLEGRVRGVWRLRQWLHTLASGWPEIERERGHEDFSFPGSHRLLQLSPNRPDIVHAHNLHGGYFDLRYLAKLSHEVPVILTLHDAWLLGGHCAHSFDCEQWVTGCSHCPDITIYPAIRRDATAHNWRLKREIYAHSRLYMATPSCWLMCKVERSILAPAIVGSRVIHNGVDSSVFHPDDRRAARTALGITPDAKVLLFAANGIRRNRWKDYETLRTAIDMVAERMGEQGVLFIALGEDAPGERIGRAEIRFIPYQTDTQVVARYYQAADLYVHAAKVDTFPNTILEALACGTPVVATAVGGIPEQIEDGVTGFLAPPGDAAAMAMHIERLLRDAQLRQGMGTQAAQSARERFNLERQVDDYLGWYQEILEHRNGGTTDALSNLG